MRKTLLTAACVSLGLLLCGGLPGAARPAAADDPAPAGTAMLSPARAFVRLWEKPGALDQVLFASVDGKTLYLGAAFRNLESVNVETGRTNWLYTGLLPPEFPPVERDHVLYLVEGGQLVTLNPDNGHELNRVRPRFSFFTPVYPSDRYAVFASGDQYVYAVTPETGAKFWRGAVTGYPTGSAWNADDMIYFTTSRGMLYGVNISSLDIIWHYAFRRSACSPPALAGNTIYVGSSDFFLYAINASIGDVQWKISLSAPSLSAPLVIGSRLYAATTEHLIHAVDLNAQKDLFQVPGDRLLTTTPDHLIYLRKDKAVNVIGMADAATGKVISEMTADQYVLFAAAPESGIVYAIGKTGGVLAIGDRDAAEEARKAAKAAPAGAAPSVAPTAAPVAVPAGPASETSPAPAPAAPSSDDSRRYFYMR